MRIAFACIAVLLCMPGVSSAARTRRRTHVHKKTKPAQPPVTFDANNVNNAATQTEVKQGDAGDAVLRAQILLDRQHFSPGEIDGHFSENTENTVRAYQKAHGLPVTGTVDQATWSALDQDQKPPLTQYTITDSDEAGPFVQIPTNLDEQAKLDFAGYQSPLEEIAEHFHSSPKLLQALNPDADFSKAGTAITVPDIGRTPLYAAQAGHVIVDKTCRCVEVVDAQNKVIAHYPATMGSSHDPLPIGQWKLDAPRMNPDFNYNPNLFWNAPPTDSKARIKPGPNNPVGTVWIGLSKKHYGIHGTPEPATIGKTASHGCIRLTNWDANDLANVVTPGMEADLVAS